MVIFQANVCFNVFLGLVTGKVWDFTGFCHVDGIWMGPVKCLVRCVTNCLSKFCHFKWWHAIWSQTWNPLNWLFFYIFFSHFKQFKPFGVIWSHLKPFEAIWILLKPFRAIWSQTGKPIFFVLLFCIFWFFLGIFPFWHLLEFYWNSLTLLQPFGAISSHLELFWATWSHLEKFGGVWRHLESFQAIASLFVPFGAIWTNLEPFRAIWRHLEPSGAIWSNLESFQPIWSQPFGAIWSHLEPDMEPFNIFFFFGGGNFLHF